MKNRFAILIACGLLTAGCVEQKMTITSDPPGALVRVSDVEVGRTPVTIPFTWVGDYDIVLRMEGYQMLSTHADLKPTAYEVFPIDLFAEISPYHYVDHRYLHFKLDKLVQPTPQQLIERATEMRKENLKPVTE